MQIGEVIAKLRERKGYTQESFTKKLGFSTSWVRAIEQGARLPSGPAIKRIASILEVDSRAISFFNAAPLNGTKEMNRIEVQILQYLEIND